MQALIFTALSIQTDSANTCDIGRFTYVADCDDARTLFDSSNAIVRSCNCGRNAGSCADSSCSRGNIDGSGGLKKKTVTWASKNTLYKGYTKTKISSVKMKEDKNEGLDSEGQRRGAENRRMLRYKIILKTIGVLMIVMLVVLAVLMLYFFI